MGGIYRVISINNIRIRSWVIIKYVGVRRAIVFDIVVGWGYFCMVIIRKVFG